MLVIFMTFQMKDNIIFSTKKYIYNLRLIRLKSTLKEVESVLLLKSIRFTKRKKVLILKF